MTHILFCEQSIRKLASKYGLLHTENEPKTEPVQGIPTEISPNLDTSTKNCPELSCDICGHEHHRTSDLYNHVKMKHSDVAYIKIRQKRIPGFAEKKCQICTFVHKSTHNKDSCARYRLLAEKYGLLEDENEAQSEEYNDITNDFSPPPSPKSSPRRSRRISAERSSEANEDKEEASKTKLACGICGHEISRKFDRNRPDRLLSDIHYHAKQKHSEEDYVKLRMKKTPNFAEVQCPTCLFFYGKHHSNHNCKQYRKLL